MQPYQSYQQQIIILQNKQKINYIELNPQGQVDIVFIHGNFGSWIWWKDIIALIQKQKKYHILAIDQRGFGKSTYNKPVSRFKDHAEDLINFIKLKKLKNVVLIGWSYGGTISLKAAQIQPNVIKKFITIGSGGHKGLTLTNQNGERVFTREQIAQIPVISKAESIRIKKDYQSKKQFFQTFLFNKMKNYPEQKKKQLIKCTFSQPSYLDVVTASANTDIDAQKINLLKQKGLLIHGREDLLIKLQSIQKNMQIFGNSFEVWENHGHMIPLQNADKFVKRIIKFIDQI